jgi:hypothetical protein
MKRREDKVEIILHHLTRHYRYLFDYTYFDRASTSRYNYMSVYKENNSFYIKLNLQV